MENSCLYRALRIGSSAALACICILAAPNVASTAQVEVAAQTPFDIATGQFVLDPSSLNPQQVLYQAFVIDAQKIEDKINAQLDLVNPYDEQWLHIPITCSPVCFDGSLDLKVHPKFWFSIEPQLSLFAPSDEQNTVVVRTYAFVALNVRTEGVFEPPVIPVDVPLDTSLTLGFDVSASVTVRVWPDFEADEVVVSIVPSSFNGSLKDQLDNYLDDILDPALPYMEDALDDAIKEYREKTEGILTARIESVLEAFVSRIRDEMAFLEASVRSATIPLPVPGVTLSLGSLIDKKIASLEVRTLVNIEQMTTALTTRFTSKPGGGGFDGRLQLPKKSCRYLTGTDSSVGSFSIPIDLRDVNRDLTQQVGSNCKSVFPSAGIRAEVYLGESPADALCDAAESPAQCKSQNGLPISQAVGTVQFKGQLTDKGSYFECAFAAQGLPATAIVDVGIDPVSPLNARLPEDNDELLTTERRSLLAKLPSGSILLNEDFEPYPAVVLGSKGPDEVLDCQGRIQRGRAQRRFDLADRFDPGKCPRCGLFRFDDDYYVRDVTAFLGTDLGRAVKRLAEGRNPQGVAR